AGLFGRGVCPRTLTLPTNPGSVVPRLGEVWREARGGLAAQAELADEFVIPFDVSTLEVVEQAPALRDHLEQPPARVVVLLVSLEVLGQLVDTLREQSYLHLRRPRVAFVRLVLVDDAFLYFRRCRHNCSRWPSQSAVSLSFYPQATARVNLTNPENLTRRPLKCPASSRSENFLCGLQRIPLCQPWLRETPLTTEDTKDFTENTKGVRCGGLVCYHAARLF